MATQFQAAAEIAVEREIDFIPDKLRANHALMYSLSSYLKDDTLCALLEGRLSGEAKALSPAAKDKDSPKKAQKIRVGWKMRHLLACPPLVSEHFATTFGVSTEDQKDPEFGMGARVKLGMVCMRLETSKEATLPNWHFCLVTHGDLLAAVRKVVSETKEGTYKDYDLERFKNGYSLETPEGIKTPFADTALSLEGAIRISLYLL